MYKRQILLGWTIFETRGAANSAAKALIEARRTTTAAEESVKVTREMGISQARAYIGVDSIKVLPWDHNETCVTRTKFKNFGQTPASDMVFIIDTFVTSRRLSPDYEHVFEHLTRPAVSRLEAGGDGYSDTGFREAIAEDQFKDLILEGAFLNIIGKITYKDVFGIERETMFRYIYHSRALRAGGGPIPDIVGNTGT